MEKSTFLEDIKSLVEASDTENALELLGKYSQQFDAPFAEDITLLKAQFNGAKHQVLAGTLSNNEESLTIAKINKGIIDLSNDICKLEGRPDVFLKEQQPDNKRPDQKPSGTNNTSRKWVDGEDIQVEDLIEDGKLARAMDKFRKFVALIHGEQEKFKNLQDDYADLNKRELEELPPPEEVEASRMQIRARFTRIVHALDKEIPKFLQVTDLPVLTRTITDQKELINLAIGAILEDYCTDITFPEDGHSSWYLRAQKNNHQQDIFIKVLKVTNIADLPRKEEIQKIVSLKSRNIIRMDKYNFDRLPAYLTLDYINGITLDKALALFGGFPIGDALRIMTELVEALDELRQKDILHTNIRPSKIFIDEDGSPMISSLDIIKLENDNLRSLTRFKEECKYMSPEILDMTLNTNNKKATERSDQFSLGLLLLEMVGGQPLFQADTVSGIFAKRAAFFKMPSKRKKEAIQNSTGNKALQGLITDMLAFKPEKRRPNLTDVMKTLEKISEQVISEDILQRSFNACYEQNKNLAEVFYQRLFQEIPLVEKHFSSLKRQYMMLRFAAYVVFEIDKKEAFLKKILSDEKHNRYTDISFFQTFLYTLRDTVKHLLEGEWDDTTMQPAWDEKIQKTLAIVATHLQQKG